MPDTTDTTFARYLSRCQATPLSITPDLDLLPDLASLGPDEARRFRLRLCATVSDPQLLEELLGTLPKEFSEFYPTRPKSAESTDSAIDAFLSKFGGAAAQQSLPDEVPIAPAGDYALLLEKEQDQAPIPLPQQTPQPDQPAAPLTESLVKMLVKNGNYQKAIEILSELNLNNPRKSIYFADQIRFLRKLIANANNNKI